MKIVQLLDVAMPITNEEHNFLSSHTGKIRITGLTERDQVVARNLVRKGIYEISNDNEHIFKKTNEKNS
jgi:hypothetical protein